MANEATITAALRFQKGLIPQINFAPGAISIDISGDLPVAIGQTIGTSEEALDLGDIGGGTLGWIIGRNLDSTNFVEFRAGTGETDLVKAKAGEPFLFRLATNTPYAIADTANVDIYYVILPD